MLVAPVFDGGANRERVFYVPWLESHARLPYADFVDRLVEISRGYAVRVFSSETNGVGEMPTQELKRKLREEGRGAAVAPVWTDAKRKVAGFSKIHGMLGRQLFLPRHPDLLRELRSLEFERTPAGNTKIAARAGYHDDLSMALLGAVSCAVPGRNPDYGGWGADFPCTRTPRGVAFPDSPRPRDHEWVAFRWAEGTERPDAAW